MSSGTNCTRHYVYEQSEQITKVSNTHGWQLATLPSFLDPLSPPHSDYHPNEPMCRLSLLTPESSPPPPSLSDDIALSLQASLATPEHELFCGQISPSHLRLSDVENRPSGGEFDWAWPAICSGTASYDVATIFSSTLQPTSLYDDYSGYSTLTLDATEPYSHYDNHLKYEDSSRTCFLPPTPCISFALPCQQSSYYNEDEEQNEVKGEDGVLDKPYARLIYEALLQAPGHKMMLREIYDWFLKYTTKAKDSGTNGWQNSIRHNLSMNKAFTNDKNESTSPSSFSRKANSVWILTQHAIDHGVESTTRYRKHSGMKKRTSQKPEILRQKSGAKGGRAARKAARLRRQEQFQYTIEGLNSVLPRNRLPYQHHSAPAYFDQSAICSTPVPSLQRHRFFKQEVLDNDLWHIPGQGIDF